MAFIPVFWWQAVAAEVYTLHVFFVALMMRLLWVWEERESFHFLWFLVGDGVEFWESPADSDAGAWVFLFDFVG